MKEFAEDSAEGKGYVSTSVKYVKKAGSGLKKIGGAAAGYAWQGVARLMGSNAADQETAPKDVDQVLDPRTGRIRDPMGNRLFTDPSPRSSGSTIAIDERAL